MNKKLTYAASDCLLTLGLLTTLVGVVADHQGILLVSSLACLAGAAIYEIPKR